MERNSIEINGILVNCTHFFRFNGKNYPFALYLFAAHSTDFPNNITHMLDEKTKVISLDDDDNLINLQEEELEKFIQYCHFKDFNLISEDDAPSLNALARKFRLEKLIIKTEEIMLNNPDKFLCYFLENSDDPEQTERFENNLSEKLNNYYNVEKIFSIPIC